MTNPTLKDAKELLDVLSSAKSILIKIYRGSQAIGFPDGSGNTTVERVTPAIGNCMCETDEAIGAVEDYIKELEDGV